MGEVMRVLCADDEPHALESLRQLISADPGLELVGSCSSGDEAIRLARELAPDLLVLDIRMPGSSGLDVVAALDPEARPLVVFATAYDDHAVEAFELHAVDYLLKPFDDARFTKALLRARERQKEGPAPGRARLEELLEERGEDRLVIHREGAMVMVPFEDILWVEAADQYVKVHGADGRTELMRASMGHVEKRLPAEDFLRVHRSAIIRRQAVRALTSSTSGTGRLTLEGGTTVPVSRTRMALVRRTLR
jgi:two-component system LytT family response regulator